MGVQTKVMNPTQDTITAKRTWIRFGISPMKVEPDVRQAKHMASFFAAGLRTDKEWFTVPVYIDPEQTNQNPGFEVAQGVHSALAQAFAHLETFRDCSCTPSKQIICRTHEQPQVN